MKPRRHLFIQLGTYPLAELTAHLEALHQAGGDLIDLIVTFTGDRNGSLFNAHLDALDPYLPWGSKRIAANVFFGTQADYQGRSNVYGTAMLDGDFRWDLLLQQRRILVALDRRYAGKTWHGYIEHEGVLDIIAARTDIATAYEAYLVQSIRDIRRFDTGKAVAWSPGFWSLTVPSHARTVLDRLAARIKMYVGEPGLDWILLQDMIGRPWAAKPEPTDVYAWYVALGEQYRSKQVNVEQFAYDGPHMVPGDPARIANFEDHYRALGMRIGASWEMRWYMRQPDLQEPTVSDEDRAIEALAALGKVGTGASWPRLAAHNTWKSRRDQVAGWLRDGVHRGSYSRRAELAAHIGTAIAEITGLEVQGIRYMRPYTPNPSTGRAVNSDHLTAGAIDIMILPTKPEETKWLGYLYDLLDELEARHVVRYVIDLGENAAHWNHIHVSFQIGAKL